MNDAVGKGVELPPERLRALDPEARLLRRPSAILDVLVGAVGVAFGAFHLYTAYFGTYPPLIQRPIHLAFGLLLGLLLYAPTRRLASRRGGILVYADIAIAAIAAFAALHLVWEFEALLMRFGAATPLNLVFGSVVLVAVFELGRRTIGPTIPLLALAAVVYSLFGPWMPSGIDHRGFTWVELVEFMYLSTDGLFGLPLGVSAEFIYVYLLFGALLTTTGAGEFFIRLAMRLTGRAVGGPAKVAVVGSAMFGTISGSVVANVLSTGAFTIPMMKRTGYPRQFAAAVESTASTGGQIMPPIMGAAAFIMAEFLQVSYSDVVVWAIIPALLYFASVFAGVHLRARRLGLRGVDEAPSESILRFILGGWPYFAAISVLVWALMWARLSPEKSAFYAVAALLVLDLLRVGPVAAGRRFFAAIVNAARIAPPIIAAVALAGIVVGGLISSGLSAKISSVILAFAGDSLTITLLLVMTVAILLGTGMTTAADYIVTSLLGVPALVALGVLPQAAHLFVLYFACLSAVTPPVALGSYVAAGVAGSPPFRTALVSARLALPCLIIPFMFVTTPGLLMEAPWGEVLAATATALLGVLSLAIAVEGWCIGHASTLERIGFAGAALCLVHPSIAYGLVGAAVFAAAFVVNASRAKGPRPSAWFREETAGTGGRS